MYLDGISLRCIAENMNKSGIRSVLGNEFQEGSVRQMIFNEVYVGDIQRQKCFIDDPISKTKAKNCGELPQYYMPDCHEAIIDRETYAKVRMEMERRAAMVNPTYCFTGKIKCGICGNSYTRRKATARGKTYVHWFCRAKKEIGESCTSINFSEEELKQICAEALEIPAFDEEVFSGEIKNIIVQESGNLDIHFYGGETKLWEMPPKPPKPVKPPRATEYQRPPHLFDGKIFCGMCDRRYGRAISNSKDKHINWRCRAKSGHNVTCDSVNYPDTEIKKIFCKTMGLDSFDEDYFLKPTERMVIQKSGSIEFHLKDGTVKIHETFKLRSNVHKTTSTDEFTGKIKCASCGNLYHRYSCYGKYVYWQCSGKSKVRTECNGQDLADCNIREISSYIMGIDEFNEAEFEKQIQEILVHQDGSLEYKFYDGRAKRWQKV